LMPQAQGTTSPPIPITNAQVGQPPLFKIPQAPPTPYVPAH
jgi:hypothetical protein